ncbi:MAG: cytochrome c oxidase subunit II [Solirubrobacterales bacterium]|nr:cytochrome c oxidase subunit II [Solirubrobacterales bacterium]
MNLGAAWLESRALRSDASDASRRRRTLRVLCGALASSVLGLLVLAPGAFANLLTPKAGGSPNANQIHSLYVIILYVAAVVFVGVEGALIYSLYKFRAKKVRVAAQIHGNTRLEIGWTIGAALILVILTVVTFVKLPSIINPPNTSAPFLESALSEPTPPNGKRLVICVQGRQFIWRYVYGAACESNPFSAKLPYSYQEMYVPADTTVVLSITSVDVIHSWWVPSLGGKVDAVPGNVTYTWFKAKGPALYHGQCAQLCGRQHAFMTALVNVISPTQYQSWLSQQRQAISTANSQVTQLRSFLTRTGNL